MSSLINLNLPLKLFDVGHCGIHQRIPLNPSEYKMLQLILHLLEWVNLDTCKEFFNCLC